MSTRKIEKKTAAEQSIPPIIAENRHFPHLIFSGTSDTILMIMIYFFNIFSELNWSTRKTEENIKISVENGGFRRERRFHRRFFQFYILNSENFFKN